MLLYIHIPFCSSKCGYCAFNSYEGIMGSIPEYMDALRIDIANSVKGECIESIFFGGGTPNVVDIALYEKIFDEIFKNNHIAKGCEITMEANPNLVTKQWCEGAKGFGVNRISMGVQSFFDEKLAFLDRDHSGLDIFGALDFLSGVIENISIDLIYDTPFDSVDFLYREFENLSKTQIVGHISAYSLSIDKGSKFFASPPLGLPKDSVCFEVREILNSFGFTQYEVSNYSKNHKCNHNIGYWLGKEYIGCGAGGIGMRDNTRLYKSKAIASYIKDPLKCATEILTPKDRRLEELFLGLRCEVGMPLRHTNRESILIEEGKCRVVGDRLVAVDYFLADEIALWLSDDVASEF